MQYICHIRKVLCPEYGYILHSATMSSMQSYNALCNRIENVTKCKSVYIGIELPFQISVELSFRMLFCKENS